MPWKNNIINTFGADDMVFAKHPSDVKSAKQVISEAKAANATFEDFEKEIVWHLYKNHTESDMSLDHIKKQVERAKKFW